MQADDTLERFALADDRAAVLATLVPGSADHDAFHVLHLQHEGRLADAQKALDAAVHRHGWSSRNHGLLRRQLLLGFSKDPGAVCDRLTGELGAHLAHVKDVPGAPTELPSRLDPQLVDGERVLRDAIDWSSDLSGVTPHAWDRVAARKELDDDRRRALLGRIDRPDLPNLVDHVLKDLAYRHSGGFGSFTIHRLLTKDQLAALGKRDADLWKNGNFVNAWMIANLPGPDADVEHDPAARRAHQKKLEELVAPLTPAFNALKLHVQWHGLDLDRREGLFDKERLIAYLQLPRHATYVEPVWLQKREYIASFGQDHRQATLLPPIPGDEELVREHLAHHLVKQDDARPFDTWVRRTWLEQLQAEAKLLAGKGEAERWYALLGDPARVAALKDRVELELASTNRTWLRAEEPVALQVDVKNVQTLVVKVFEVDALNVIQATGREPDTALDLDGLVPGEERVLTFDDPPLRRVRREVALPSLTRPGTFVVELIGGGRSSRALIRKGTLRHVERLSAAGHAFTILDEAGRALQDATLWLDGREHRPDSSGEVRVPFSTSPGRRSIVLRHGALATLETFEHRAESYELAAGLYVDREQLARGRTAHVLVNAQLRLAGTPVSLALLEQTALVIETQDGQGTTSSQTVNVQLAPDRELAHELAIPDGLRRLSVTLRGQVRAASTAQRVQLQAAREWMLNGVDATDQVHGLHLARAAAGWVLSLLGKAGEARAGVPVQVWLRHRLAERELEARLQTDAHGRVELGPLPDVLSVRAQANGASVEGWSLEVDACRLPQAVHGRVGEALRLPWSGPLSFVKGGSLREHLALFERRGSGLCADRFEHLRVEDGQLVLKDLPAADYELRWKRSGARIEVRVSVGPRVAGWVAGARRLLEAPPRSALSISRLELSGEGLVVGLAGAGPEARVHVIATRFLPAHGLHHELVPQDGRRLRACELAPGLSAYVSGRDIGDEYRYILERKRRTRRPGVMLERPGLLLNPWALRDTDTGLEQAKGGSDYKPSAKRGARREMDGMSVGARHAEQGGGHATLDFLADVPGVVLDLRPDAKGTIRVPRAALGRACHVRVLALDQDGGVLREVNLEEQALALREVRLAHGLDPARHFAQRRRVDALPGGGEVALQDAATSRAEVYDTLGRVFELLGTLSGRAGELEPFRFLLSWLSLTPAEKSARYSAHACHELHLFLQARDPAFFDAVVRPYLRHKREKQAIDRVLLDEEVRGYLEPWAWSRLNVVERILVAARIQGEPAATAQHVADLASLERIDAEGDEARFRAALGGSALDPSSLQSELRGGDGEGTRSMYAACEVSAMDSLAQPAFFGGAAGPGGPPMPSAPCPSPAAAAPPPPPRRASTGAAKKSKMAKEDKAEADDICDEAEEEPAPMERERPADDDRRRRDGADLAARAQTAALFRAPDPTRELGERQFWRVRQEEQTRELVRSNPFWVDFARHVASGRDGPFTSTQVTRATGSTTEMLLALAVLDLPLAAPRPAVTQDGPGLKLAVPGAAIVFREEVREVEPGVSPPPVLVSQAWFRQDDRWSHEPSGEQVEKPVTGELLTHVVYACRVVLTNPTPTTRRLEILLQIPRGAVPVSDGFRTRGRQVVLGGYQTQAIEYSCYFPAPGSFGHYPVHVSLGDALVASAPPSTLVVVREPTVVDRTSWRWVSQSGSDEEVLAFLERANLERLELPLIAWRMRERRMFERTLALLSRRHVWSRDLWGYGLLHRDAASVATYVRHQEDWLRQAGPVLRGGLVDVDPVLRGWYEHREYLPLINARAHELGGRRKVLNDRQAAQWRSLLDVLASTPVKDDHDALALVYHLLLQDRLEEGLTWLARIEEEKLSSQRLQLEYLRCWGALAEGDVARARAHAQPHAEHPVDRWRQLFRTALAHADEAEGKTGAAAAATTDDAAEQQGRLAAATPSFEVAVENRALVVTSRHLSRARVRYHLMDVELLFSRQPFVQQQTRQFSFVAANHQQEVALDPSGTTVVELPDALRKKNVVVEVEAGGQRRTLAHLAHALDVQVIEAYGQVRVGLQASGSPLPATYVKVYARMRSGQVEFYKDGYTDARGRFDHASLSTNDLGRVERFALLVLSDEHGAVIREAAPPTR